MSPVTSGIANPSGIRRQWKRPLAFIQPNRRRPLVFDHRHRGIALPVPLRATGLVLRQ